MEIRAVLPTDAGMHALWDRAHCRGIVDYQTWEPELVEDEDVERHIALGHLVPINIHSDGAFAFTLRTDPDFIVSIGPSSGDAYRLTVETFEPE